MTPPTDRDALLAAADLLVSDGRPIDAVELLAEANRGCADAELEVRLRDLRHEAALSLVGIAGPTHWPPHYPDPWPDLRDELPEITPDQFTTNLLGGSVLHHGCLLIRGLISADDAGRAVELIQTARRQIESPDLGTSADHAFYHPYDSGRPGDTGLRRRGVENGALWLADSPAITAHVLDLLHDAGVVAAVAGHLGVPPVFSLQKSTLRAMAPAHRFTTWHQDGAFLEPSVRTMNVWIALSRCGGDHAAPGMEVMAGRVEKILPTDDDFGLDAIRGEAMQELATGMTVVSPEFEPGDALLFDERFVHRSDLRAGLSETRYAVECWLFSPSHTTSTYVPFLV